MLLSIFFYKMWKQRNHIGDIKNEVIYGIVPIGSLNQTYW